MARIGVDVGGTNTDLVLECRSGIFFHKVPSTPEDQSTGVIDGVQQICRIAGISGQEVELIAHGTTVATNITIEHNGAEVGFLTTRGFRDILHIGRHKRPMNFSLHFDVPWQARPLARRRNRIAISERILPPQGRVETPLDEDEVRAACATFRRRGIKSVAIGFMFSFLNETHERRAKEIVLEEIPDAYVTLSCEVANVVREYERFSTAAMNAYVGPKTSTYLRNLERKVREAGFPAKVRVIQSNGGISTIDGCSRKPTTILMSGPAGGVIGGVAEAELAGTRNVMTIDIGGTSADISTIPNGSFRIMNARDTFVGGHAVLTPMIDLITIGAGGGSIAYIDEAGGFNVGPRSAGAMPGPACYGRGGTEPTVTDAQVVLGRMDPEKFLGGDLPLSAELAHSAIKTKIADPLGISVTEAALGIIRVVNSNMALAIRSNSIARGLDPRDFSLMPFGGAGPFHGVALAEAVSAKDVLVPIAPGITAAMGLLSTDIQYEHVRSVITPLITLTEGEANRVNEVIAQLMQEGARDLDSDGIPDAERIYEIVAECRYHGQGFELRAPLPEGRLSLENRQQLIEDFHAQHRSDYGYTFDDTLVELYNVRVIARVVVPHIALPELQQGHQSQLDTALLYHRDTTFDDGSKHATPRYDRTKLGQGVSVDGPAILVQHNSTTLLPPGYRAEVLRHGSLRIARL
ncbi:hydantoinase/oxoprolinase family protein [Agrobacterium pusense]|uniref:Hydantoinase/oxoprolinase family protein n=1 Tax=Agrobacterium pusense TaxID=648995 RepID=A0AA44EGV7_9HYPH|nr:hydantoinase/oxoprolinase family protein [Agrobacterium pusense]NRF07223.1 hydantoinase/oxoprolinase family protein [Agrobacterium pusense]NRF17777.1 hydantoinase/oxoprolinase family protein [Agrobacterium pusense]